MAAKQDKQQPDAVVKALKAGTPSPLYFIYASERPSRAPGKKTQSPYNDYLLDKLIDAFRKAIVDGNTRDFNYSQFIADEAGMGAVVDVAQTYPMMRAKRLVIVKDAHNFKSDDWKNGTAYLENPSPSTVLVMIGEHLPTSSKGGAAAQKLVKATCTMVPVEPFRYPKDVLPYLHHELKQRGLALERSAEALLLDLLGADMNELLSALDKLELFAAGQERIGLKDVEQCVAQTRAEELWGFQDAVAERRLAPALMHLARLLENAKPDDEIRLVGSLASHFKGMAEVRRQIDGGKPEREVLLEMGRGFANEKRVKQAARHSTASMAIALEALQDLDRGLRSSRVPHHALFERFVIRACGGR